MRLLVRALLLLFTATLVIAQNTPPANPYSTFDKVAYARIQATLVRAAEKMPEENYSFKPVDSVRTFGQIVGHIADAQYSFCSTATGDKNPNLNIEKTKTSKADLVAALKESSAYCTKAYDSMNDATGAQLVDLFGQLKAPRLGVLTVNLMHDDEHYGNLVTYMRIKNIVPPTSEQQATPAPPPNK